MIVRSLSSRGVNVQPAPEQVERLDLVAHECRRPVELGLELRLGLEVPSHVATPCARRI